MARKSFGATPADREREIIVNTDAFADLTAVNLDTGELQVVEVDRHVADLVGPPRFPFPRRLILNVYKAAAEVIVFLAEIVEAHAVDSVPVQEPHRVIAFDGLVR